MAKYDEILLQIIESLIYHGRHFSATRDKVVIDKSFEALIQIIEKGEYALNTRSRRVTEDK
jgi:hypothetical protein